MRIRSLLFFASIVLLTYSTSLNATPILVSPAPTTVHPVEMLFKKLATMKTRDYQALLGHRLSLKERIMFLAMRERARHYVKHGISQEEINQVQKKLLYSTQKKAKRSEDGSSQGKTALIFGIIAAATLVGGLFVGILLLPSLISSILAIAIGSSATRKNPDDSNGHTGKLLGWITLGLIVVLLIAVVILISTWAIW